MRSDQVIKASLEGKGKLQHVTNFWKRPSKANLVMEFPNMRGRHGLLLFWLVQICSFTFFNKSHTISWSSNFHNQSGYDDDGMLFLGSIDDIRCCDSMGTST